MVSPDRVFQYCNTVGMENDILGIILMGVTTFLNLLVILIAYILAAAIVSVIPTIIVLFFYARKMNEYRKTTGLNPYAVPIRLRHLLPLVKKWEIENDEERNSLFQEATSEDRLELSNKITGKTELINRWLQSFNNRPFTPEAKAFYLFITLVAEKNLVIEPFDDQETELINANNLHNASLSFPKPMIRGYTRVIKIPKVIRGVFAIVSFVMYFIVLGKLWAFLFPSDFGTIGLVIVNFLSGLATISTGSLVIASIRLFGKRKIELIF